MQDLFQEETDRAIARMPNLDRPGVGAFDGFARGTAQTAAMNFAKAGRSMHTLSKFINVGVDYFTGGTESLAKYYKRHSEFEDAVQFWSPDPETVGVAGQITGQLLSVIPMMMANPTFAASAMGIGIAEDLTLAGVSKPKAIGVGVTQGLLGFAGMKAPIFGKTMAQRVLAGGVGFNLAQGTAMRASAQAILQGTPGEEWFHTFDTTEFLLDVIMGAAFGGIVHMTPQGRAQSAAVWERLESYLGRNAKQIDKDALSVLRVAAAQQDVPGTFATPADAVAHAVKARRALQLLLSDNDVVVDDVGGPVHVLPDPVHEAEVINNIETLGESAADVRALEGIPEDTTISPIEDEAGLRRASDIVNPIDRNASTDEKVRQLVALGEENAALVEPVLRQLDKEIGSESVINFKDPENIVSKAERPSVKAKKPWHDVEHIRDAFRFMSAIDKLDVALPKIAELVKKHGWRIVKVDTAKLTDPLQWGWRFVALDLRMPNGQIVEYQIIPREIEVAKKANHVLFDNWRNEDWETLPIGDLAMLEAALLESRKRYNDAWNSYLYRVDSDAIAARASVTNFATSLGSVTARNDSANSSPVGRPALPAQTPSTNAPAISGVESTTTRPSSSDLDTTVIEPPDRTIAQNQALSQERLPDPGAPGVPGETILPPPRGDVGAAGAEGFMKLPPEQRVTTYEEIGERFGGDTDLNPIITQLAKTYIEQGPVAGRALLDKRFPRSRMTKELGSREAGIEYVNGLDEALTAELDRVKKYSSRLSRREPREAAPDKPDEAPRADILETVAEDMPRPVEQDAAGEVTPLQFAAERFAIENPDLPIHLGKDTNGDPITTTARQMLDDAQEAAARAREDIPLFEAAAACLLGKGQ